MNIRVSENFIILALNPRSGNYMIYGNYLNYGFLGAVLMDLALAGRIRIGDGRMSAIEEKGITGIHVHDRMYERLLKSSRPMKISYWIRRLAFNSGWYVREMRNMLVNNGVLRQERKRFLLIPYKLHYVSDLNRRKKLVLRLKEILLYNKPPDDDEGMLLGIIYASKLHKALSDESDERRKIRRALVKFMKEGHLAAGSDSVMREIQMAISSSIAASVVASSGASH
ncbi:MAG: GPP34 family phosphoprotein [Bacteroidales bacterium]